MSPRSALTLFVLSGICLPTASSFPAVWSEIEVVGIQDAYHDYDPEVAIDPQGRAWITWMGVDEVGIDYEIYWSRWEPATGWSPRQRVHPNNTLYDAWPRLNMAPDGTAWVAWLRRRSTGSWDLLSSHWNGTGWTVPDTVVAAPAISDADYHGVAAVDSTHCWVIYDGLTQVYAKQYVAGRWGSAEVVASAINNPWQSDAALSPNGQPWAVWSADGIYASRRYPDGTWEPRARLDPPGVNGVSPEIAVDAAEDAWVTWTDDSYWCPPSDWYDVFYNRTINGVWQTAFVVSEYETSDCSSDVGSDIAVAYGWPGRATWSLNYPGGTADRYSEPYSSSWDSEAWSPQSQLNPPDSGNAKEDRDIKVAIGPSGEAWATWQRTGAAYPYYDIYASRLLLDVITLDVHRTDAGVEIGWRIVGYASPGDFLFAVVRAGDFGDTVQVNESFYGQGTEYLVVDETAALQARYYYWVQVLDPIEGMDPPTGTFLFRTNTRTVEPLTVSVEPDRWRRRVVLRSRPNPSGGDVAFEFVAPAGQYVLEVFDVQGRLAWRTEVEASGSSWNATAWSGSISGAPAGVYWARIRSDGGSAQATSKLILLR